MADRTLNVILSARVQGFVAGFKQAQQAAKDLGGELGKAKQYEQEFNLVGGALTGVGLAAAAGVGLAIKSFADFDQSMSNVQAATHETAGAMAALREAALDAGARTVFSATESANAIEELAKAGISTADILAGGLDGALDLAAAGGLGVAEAAGIAATALQQFQLEGSDMAHVADLLAAGAGKAMGDVTDLSNALKFVGPVAASMKISIEETTGALAMFASQGILGEQAGTSLRGVLSSLTSPSAMARRELDRLGVTLYDAQGNFLGLSNMAGELSKAYEGMTDQQKDASLGIIFGNQQVTAARILYQGGAEAVNEWTAAVDDSGYAAETAATRLDNLHGDLEALGGALETALIETGSHSNDVLRDMVQWLGAAVDAYNALPAPIQSSVLTIGLLTAGVGLAGGAFFLATPKIVEFRAATKTLNAELPRTTAVIKGLGVAAGVVAAVTVAHALRQWANEASGATKSAAALRLELKEGASAAKLIENNLGGGGVAFGLLADGGRNLNLLLSEAGQLSADIQGSWVGTVAEIGSLGSADTSLAATRDTLRELDAVMAELVTSGNAASADALFAELVKHTDGSKESIDALIKLLPGYREAQLDATDATGKGASAAKKQADALWGIEDAAEDAADATDDLADKIRNFGKEQFDTEQATLDFYSAVDDLTAALHEEGASLDVTTEAGRNVHSAMLDVAGSTNDYAASVAAMGGSTEEVQGILEAGRKKIVETRMALGDSREAAELYADQLISTPEMITTTMRLLGINEIQRNLDNFFAANNGRTIYAGMRIANGRGGGGNTFADGGPTGDHIPANAIAGVVHGKEFVSKASTVAIPENRAALEFMHRGGVIRGYRDGGYVQPVYAPPAPQYMVMPSMSIPGARPSQSQAGPVVLARESAELVAELMSQKLKGYSRTDRRGWAI